MRETVVDVCFCAITVIVTLQVGVMFSDFSGNTVEVAWWEILISFFVVSSLLFGIKNKFLEIDSK